MFDIIDADENRKIDIYEFKAALNFIEKCGLSIYNPYKIFNEIDDNKKDIITFDEFCYWSVKYSLRIPDSDTFPDYDSKTDNNL